MKYAPAGVATFLASRNTIWRADLYTLTLLSGTVYRWTTADFNLAVGGNTYLADGTVLSRGNSRNTSKLEVDVIDVQLAGGAQLSGQTVALQAANGLFDDARLQIDHLVGAYPGDVSLGAVPAWFEGRVAGTEPDALDVRLSVQSEVATLSTVDLPRFTFNPNCMNAVYDANCGLAKATFTITGAASGSPTTTNVPTTTAALVAKGAGYFNLGVIAFTSGALTGFRRSIRTWDGTNFLMGIPLSSAPAAGDAFNVYPGCPRTQAVCQGTFNNLVRIRSFPHIPAPVGAF